MSQTHLIAEDFAAADKSHWVIENRLHRVLDVSFGQDGSTIRKDHAPQNLSLLKKIVLNIIRADTTHTAKASLRLKRKAAAWDDQVSMNMFGLRALSWASAEVLG